MPGLSLHEFETWVIASAMARTSLLGRSDVAESLKGIAAGFADDVELVNDGPATAPSKRVATAWPGYQKVFDGVAAVEEAGLEHVLERCPALAAWIDELCRPIASSP